jgi:hypothetical protein
MFVLRMIPWLAEGREGLETQNLGSGGCERQQTRTGLRYIVIIQSVVSETFTYKPFSRDLLVTST